MSPSVIDKQVETELTEREWELFGDLDKWTITQREHWRQAWRNWRYQHLCNLLSGQAKMRIWIESSCIGCFDCEIMCPSVFSMSGKRSMVRKDITVKNPDFGPHIHHKVVEKCLDEIELAKDACPVNAISVCVSDPEHTEPLPQDFHQ